MITHNNIDFGKLVLSAMIGLIAWGCNTKAQPDLRVTEDFNFGWKFHHGPVENAYQTDFSDKDWQEIRLPHDWSVTSAFTQENTAGATAFLPGGIGWYRKTFSMPSNAANKITWIEFDGVYSNAEVWINGTYLGKRPYGYIPFKYDLTPYLKYGSSNQIAVKADRSAYIDCRWYPGSGIYRNVKLVTTNKIHIPQWGVFVTTPKVTDDNATIAIQTDLKNQLKNKKTVTVSTFIYYDNVKVGHVQNEINLPPGSLEKLRQEVTISNPRHWDTENPNMYEVVSEILFNKELVDRKETPFGIRHFHFDKEEGFFLNGKNTLIQGVCLHHDGGLVGSAVPIGVWERRLQTLKDGGCNAIRTAHNPPSEEFLDLCDRMGFLVQDEAFDEWNNPKDKHHNYNQQKADPLTNGYTEHFSEWSERDVKNMVLRDRNHPSIIMWSIGNEIEWTYPRYGSSTGYWGSNKVGNVDYYWDEPPLSIAKIKKNFSDAEPGQYNLAETAKSLVNWVKQVDDTRPVTANLVIPSVGNFSGYSNVLDIVGLSYRQAVYDYVHQNYPEMTFIGTENWTRYHEWKPVIEKKFISGIFLWTGINYMGESKSWPKKGSGSGLLDFAGFKKPSYHMFKALWSDEPHVYVTTQLLEKSPYQWDPKAERLMEKEENWAARQKWGWQEVNEHWNYEQGENIAVEVYTNQPEVELFLNGKSLGIQKLEDQNDHILKWLVPYTDGQLTARAMEQAQVEASIQTAGAFNQLLIKSDKTSLSANARDVAHFTVQLADKQGNPIQHTDREVIFHIKGDVKLLGVDNGAPANVQKYQNDRLTTSSGRALMILQANLNPSKVEVMATSGNVESETIKLTVQ
ncbi:glycoside hydrolase family 2 protein [Fulvivirga sp. M361]|nr:glycoside hydrolase family 2 protein [Fulvivirga sp. M361]